MENEIVWRKEVKVKTEESQNNIKLKAEITINKDNPVEIKIYEKAKNKEYDAILYYLNKRKEEIVYDINDSKNKGEPISNELIEKLPTNKAWDTYGYWHAYIDEIED